MIQWSTAFDSGDMNITLSYNTQKDKVLVKSKVCKSQKLSTNSSTRLALVLSSNSSGENR